MNWLQLDPDLTIQRIRAANGNDPHAIPSLAESILRGMVGFSVASVVSCFSPMVLYGPWLLMRRIPEVFGETRDIGTIELAGLYLVSAAGTIGLSGPVLHKLIIGPGSLQRFYKLFSVAFAAYSVVWIALPGNSEFTRLLAGTVLMGWILTSAFRARSQILKVIATMFFLNLLTFFGGQLASLAYPIGSILVDLQYSKHFAAEIIRGMLSEAQRFERALAMLQGAVFYGLGFGAGIGMAFHLCQNRLRALIRGLK